MSSKSGKKTGSSSDDDPPYARYAFLNPYNLSLLAGAGATAAATGHWWIAVCAAATEGLWMLFAPDSKVLRAAWFDKRWELQQRARKEDAEDAKLARMWPADVVRFRSLREQKGRIEKLAADNPSLTVDLMGDELAKIDGLLTDFLDLALTVAKTEQHLQSFDFKDAQRTWQQYSAQVKAYPQGDRRRDVAEKNLEVLTKRRARFEELGRIVATARGQMDLMENTFRLLADEILTMASPTELGSRLDDLRIGVEAIRETTDEASGGTQAYEELEALEEAEQQEEQQQQQQNRRAR